VGFEWKRSVLSARKFLQLSTLRTNIAVINALRKLARDKKRESFGNHSFVFLKLFPNQQAKM